jgi:hypothetical protein
VKTSDPSSVHVGGLVLRGRRLVVLNKVRRRRHRRSVSMAVVIIHDVDHEVRLHYRVIAVVVVIVAYTIHGRRLIVIDMVRKRNLLLDVHQNHVSIDNKKMRSHLLFMILLYRTYNHYRVEHESAFPSELITSRVVIHDDS